MVRTSLSLFYGGGVVKVVESIESGFMYLFIHLFVFVCLFVL